MTLEGPAGAVTARPEPGLRLVRAPNPSPMTFSGTNTWIVGTGAVAVIDPGPRDRRHLEAILAALEPGEHVHSILVTHAHRDHAPLAQPLSDCTGADVYAAGDLVSRRRPVMARLAAAEEIGGGEGIDLEFAPDHRIDTGDRISGPGWHLDVLATPGHTADHLAFRWGDAVFTGDHVMGWASSLVSPPDGDLVSFMASCDALSGIQARVYYPGHGDPVPDPMARLAWLIAHRTSRTEQICAALQSGPMTPAALTQQVYAALNPDLFPAAERNVLAHLIALSEAGHVAPDGRLSTRARFSLVARHNGASTPRRSLKHLL
ncbi:MAG: MBL fold metallo-hydrolase [Pseudomonadota bacterium]